MPVARGAILTRRSSARSDRRRFSLIFYRTEGAVEEVQAAIFEVPRTLEEMQEAQKSNQIVPFTKVNGFTAGHDGGNPAGVVLPEIAKTVPPASRVAVAHAIGYSETCFVDSIETNPLRISLNYYTPVEQVDVCGHATVACLGLLLKEGLLPAPVADNGGMIEGALNLQCGEVRFEIVGQEVFMSQLPVRVAALEEDSLKRLLECLRVKGEWRDAAVRSEATRWEYVIDILSRSEVPPSPILHTNSSLRSLQRKTSMTLYFYPASPLPDCGTSWWR